MFEMAEFIKYNNHLLLIYRAISNIEDGTTRVRDSVRETMINQLRGRAKRYEMLRDEVVSEFIGELEMNAVFKLS